MAWPCPRGFHFFPSMRFHKGYLYGGSVRDSIKDSVRDSVRHSRGDSIRDSKGDHVSNFVTRSMEALYKEFFWDAMRNSIVNSKRDSMKDSV